MFSLSEFLSSRESALKFVFLMTYGCHHVTPQELPCPIFFAFPLQSIFKFKSVCFMVTGMSTAVSDGYARLWASLVHSYQVTTKMCCNSRKMIFFSSSVSFCFLLCTLLINLCYIERLNHWARRIQKMYQYVSVILFP